ncbi:MAG: NADH:flavin oxidoreductase, partial [Pseudomonadota bacterium]|nr:NADH:flavin oxidoreductase [Pseudomonadota bacterium]
PGFNRAYAREFAKALNIPVICVGGMADRATMDDAIFSGDCDMVSVARGLIADPHLYSHMQQGIAGPECDNCNGCIARAGAMPLACYNPAVAGKSESL